MNLMGLNQAILDGDIDVVKEYNFFLSINHAYELLRTWHADEKVRVALLELINELKQP